MSDEENTDRLIENVSSLTGDALLHAVRRDLQGLFAQFKALDEKVDARMHDTVPIWEGVVSRLDAIAAEQQSQGRRLDAIEGRLDAIEGRLDAIEGRLDAIEGRLDAIEGRLSAVEGRLDAVEQKLDRLEVIETELRHLRRRIEGMIGELSRDVVEVRAAQRDLEDRLEKLEKKPA